MRIARFPARRKVSLCWLQGRASALDMDRCSSSSRRCRRSCASQQAECVMSAVRDAGCSRARGHVSRSPAVLLLAAAAVCCCWLPSLVAASADDHAPNWQYGGGDNGPERWPFTYPQCNGTRQSPIKLQDAIFDKNLHHMHFDGYHRGEHMNFTLVNDGHSVKLKLPSVFHVSGGNLNGRYVADSLHFHWGKMSSRGSEHTFKGKRFPMEMHIVHVHERHNSLHDIERNGSYDSLAVTGFLFEISSRDNVYLQPLIDGLQRIHHPDEHTVIRGFPLDYLLPTHHHFYFRYEGSLTVPNCMERVTWTVFADRIPISNKQLAHFRQLKDHSGRGLYDNYRPEQPLHDRPVYTNIHSDEYWFPIDESNRAGGAPLSGILCAACMLLTRAVTLLGAL